MSRLKQSYASEGFFGIGILNPELEENIGTPIKDPIIDNEWWKS